MTAAEPHFRRVAILGTGLIGGSFGLALRKHLPEIRVTGWDKEAVLRRGEARGAIHEGTADRSRALAGADLVYLALPIGLTIELLPEIASRAERHALVTDACSTKRAVCRAAERHFPSSAENAPCFLGGHPMAGKEEGGISGAAEDLFRGARYVLIRRRDEEEPASARAAEMFEADNPSPAAAPEAQDARVKKFEALIQQIGAQPVWLDAETHDWAAAIVSHLPQLVSVALARVVHDETDETGLPVMVAGRGLRDALRLAGSPYHIWRDIGLTNTDNISRALDRVALAIENLRTHLASRQLEEEFDAANELYKILRDLQ